MQKRYYWLKLKEDFLSDKRMKKLIKLSGGKPYLSIYLKLMLSTLKTEGVITYENLEDTLAGELALVLNEDEESVQVTIDFLMKTELMLDMGNNQYFLPEVAANLGSEGASAQRVRAYRERQKALHCNTDVTATPLNSIGEIEKENRIINFSKENHTKSATPTLPQKKKQSIFKKPSIEEIKQYADSKGLSIDAQLFWSYYESVGWICGKVPMSNWKSAVCSWVRRERKFGNKGVPVNSYRSFQQNEYDFNQLEKDLMKN